MTLTLLYQCSAPDIVYKLTLKRAIHTKTDNYVDHYNNKDVSVRWQEAKYADH